MNTFLKQGNAGMQKMGALWAGHLRLIFFLILIGIFVFSVFEWYRMVYAPENRIEVLKKEILQSEKENFNMKQFEDILGALEKRNTESPDATPKNDLFYR